MTHDRRHDVRGDSTDGEHTIRDGAAGEASVFEPSGKRPTTGEPEPRRPLVLVVDDDLHDREIYGTILWYNGFDVLYAPDGEQGLALMREVRPDLVLLDLMLPKLDGFEFIGRLKDDPETADVPVIVISGRSEHEWGNRLATGGFLRYIEKPVSPLVVLHAVEGATGRPPLAGEGPPTPEANAAD